MTRGGVLVIGPNRAFLSYIRNVLPALGELNVSQTTLADLLAQVPVRATDSEPRPPGSRAIPGWPRCCAARCGPGCATPPSRSCWPAGPGAGGYRPRSSTGWSPSCATAASATAAGRDMLGHRIAHVILTRMEAAGETCDDRTHDAVRRTRPVRAAVDAIWPKADPVRLVLRLLSDRALLARGARTGC